MFKKSIIISGGLGTRMLPITEYLPKASIRLGEHKLSEYSINFFKKNGINQIFMTYSHLSEILFKDFKDKINVFINTNNKDNSFFLTQTFVSELDEPILIVPCDIIFKIDLNKLYLDYIDLGSPEILLVPVNIKDGCDGDFIHYENNIVNKLDRNIKSEIYCSGIQVINPKKLNNLINEKFDNFYSIWSDLIKIQKLKVSNIFPEEWKSYDKIRDIL